MLDTTSSSGSSGPTSSGFYDYDYEQQQTPSLTRRVADAVFSPVSYGLATIIGIPLVLAAAYWLFVVNGPTPVVRAKSLALDEESILDGGLISALDEFLRVALEAVRPEIDEA